MANDELMADCEVIVTDKLHCSTEVHISVLYVVFVCALTMI